MMMCMEGVVCVGDGPEYDVMNGFCLESQTVGSLSNLPLVVSWLGRFTSSTILRLLD